MNARARVNLDAWGVGFAACRQDSPALQLGRIFRGAGTGIARAPSVISVFQRQRGPAR